MEIGYRAGIRRYKEIVLLHLTGACMILACHFVQKEHLAALGELLISGVPLFLFISGFLSGLKRQINKSWMIKRAIRILTPFYIWIFPCILILWISNHEMVTGTQILFLSTNMQGLNYIYWKSEIYSALPGLGHLWFTTEIMLCYLLVPIFNKLIDKQWKKSIWIFIMCGVILIVQPVLIQIGIQSSYVITFFLGYLVASYGCKITDRFFILITVICFIITGIRLGLMNYIDGTNYYDRYIALISSAAVGIWIFFFVFWISSKSSELILKISRNKWVSYLSDISFEIYITHFWFLMGKWQISNYINNILFSDLIVIVLTIIFAGILHSVSQKVVCRINQRTKVI